MKCASLSCMFARTMSCIALSACVTLAAFAQDKPAQTGNIVAANANSMKFDVVSIHPARPDEGGFEDWEPTGFSAVVSLRSLVLAAYFGGNNIPRGAISGGPNWVDGERWSIRAKVAPEDIAEYQRHPPMLEDPPDAQGWSMLRSVLTDRFHLLVHHVPGEMDGYALMVGKNGPKMKAAAANETQPPGTVPDFGGYIDLHDSSRQNFYSFRMGALAQFLRMAGPAVVDHTGLAGRYDFTLKWLSSGDENDRPGMIPANDPAPLSHWDLGALGLRAEHVKLPIEYIVVDHVERPTEN